MIGCHSLLIFHFEIISISSARSSEKTSIKSQMLKKINPLVKHKTSIFTYVSQKDSVL